MPGVKRKSAGGTEVASKRARASLSSAPAIRTEDELNDMSKEELVEYALQLQDQITSASTSAPASKVLSAKELEEQSKKARQLLVKGISSQMKWTASCKTGKARFAYDGQFSDERIFKKMFGLPENHVKKIFKISNENFHYNIGHPQGKVRYSVLNVTGAEVNIRWSPEERTYKVSGTYGV